MSRNTEKNIKKHNDKLRKTHDKVKQAKLERAMQLKTIIRKHSNAD